jgi:predicted DNA-binding protein (MmcQ/YjbR family)
MSVDFVRRHCLSFPHSTETVQWGNDLVFKIGGKMFAVAALEPPAEPRAEPGGVWVSFKCTPDDFADLTERPGIIPAPYLARAQWVALETEEALPAGELKRYLRKSYDLVFEKLPKKVRASLGAG